MSTLSKINLNGTQYDIKEKLSLEYTSYNIAYEPLPGDYVETAISKLHKVILDNEYVTVSALSELNDKAIETIYVDLFKGQYDQEFSKYISLSNNNLNPFSNYNHDNNPFKILIYTHDDYVNDEHFKITCYLTIITDSGDLIYTGYDSTNLQFITIKLTDTDEGIEVLDIQKTPISKYELLYMYYENNDYMLYDKYNNPYSIFSISNNNKILYNNELYYFTYSDQTNLKFINISVNEIVKWINIDIYNGRVSIGIVDSPASLITDADIANWNSKTSNVGTITGITMNGVSKGTAGVVDLGTVITAHQDISGKQDVITDLETIRSNAALGATALQNYNETDPIFVRSVAYNITSTDIGNWNSKTSNVGTITGITMNGTNKGTSGIVDLGTVITDISGKVDKESGKGLSTNDYTSAEKTKLASINIGDLSNLTTTELNTIFS